MALLDYYQDTVSADSSGAFYGTQWVCQLFTPATNQSVESVELSLTNGVTVYSGTDLTASIYATSAGAPTGSPLATKTVDATLAPRFTFDWVLFTFASALALTSGTQYAIVVSAPLAAAGNYLGWNRLSTYEYAGGQRGDSANSGSTWTMRALGAMLFRTYGDVTTADPINPNDKKYTRNIVTFCNNQLFYGASPTTMVELAAAKDDIDCSKPLQAAEAYGKVFVANDTKFRIADFVNSKLTTTNIGTIPYHGDIIRGGTSSAAMVVDYITAVSGATTIYGNRISTETFSAGETVTGTNKNGDAVSFTTTVEVAGPHWYAWTPYGNDTTNFGTMPTTASIVKLHIGKLWLMGDTQYPHQWYATRQNNPFDFLYSQNDAGSAVAGNNTDAGECGDIIIDAVSYSDDYMVFGCASELYVLLGNPCAGGRLDKLRPTGLLAPRAWTWNNDQTLFLLTQEGMLAVPKGFGQAQNVLGERYPDFIKDLAYDPLIHRVSMAYDPDAKGVLISRVTISSGANTGWFYDERSGGLFPESYPVECSIYGLWNFVADAPADRALLIASNDGYIREWDSATKSDDAGESGDTAITAYVGYGPILTAMGGGEKRFGRLANISAITGGDGAGGANDSDTLYCKVYTEASAEKLIKDMTAGADPRYTRNIKVPAHRKGNADRRKVRGRYCGMVIGNDTASESFALEQVTFNIV